MFRLNSAKLAVLDLEGGKKVLIYTAVIIASLMTGNAARAFDLTGGTIPSIAISGTSTVDDEIQEWTAILDPVSVVNTSKQDKKNVTIKYKQNQPIIIKFKKGDSVIISDLSNILDPTGTFSQNYTDFGAPSSFSTTVTFAPFAPTMTGLVNFTGSVAGSITDGSSPRNGISYTPSSSTVFTYKLFDTTNTLVNSFGLDLGASFSAGPPDTHTVGPFNGGLVADCGAVGCGKVQVITAFLGSGGTDRYSFTGRWDATEPTIATVRKRKSLTPEQSNSVQAEGNSSASTPEPSALLSLALLGLAGMGGLKKKCDRSPE